MCARRTFPLHAQNKVSLYHDPMLPNDETFERFRQDMKERYCEEITPMQAKERYLNLMHLFWILAHKIPTEDEPPYEVHLPPWL